MARNSLFNRRKQADDVYQAEPTPPDVLTIRVIDLDRDAAPPLPQTITLTHQEALMCLKEVQELSVRKAEEKRARAWARLGVAFERAVNQL